MNKTLAETIREALDTINEASNLEYALADLHKESGGNPTPELASEIAVDYAGVNAERLLAAYPQWAQTQVTKTNTPPPVDPKKAKEIAKHQQIQQRNKWDQERADRTAAQKADSDSFRAKHSEVINEIKAEMEAIQSPVGWTKTIQPGQWAGKQDIADMVFTNDSGDISLVMHVIVCDPDATYTGNDTAPEVPYQVHGDTRFKVADKWYTFTDYSKWGDSFLINKYSRGSETFAAIPDIIAEEEARARAAINRKQAKGL